jgi:hypothetical protein
MLILEVFLIRRPICFIPKKKYLENFHCNILTCHTLASVPLGKRPSTCGIGG